MGTGFDQYYVAFSVDSKIQSRFMHLNVMAEKRNTREFIALIKQRLKRTGIESDNIVVISWQRSKSIRGKI